MSAREQIPYLKALRESNWRKQYQDDQPIQSFRGPKPEGDVWERLEFAEKCLEHERIQLRKTVEILRRVERERDELLAAAKGGVSQ